MKTDFLKKLLPVMIMAIAVIGAFTTHAMETKAEIVAIENGYVQLDPAGAQCELDMETACTSTITNELCTVDYRPSGNQLFKKDESGNCTIQLYRPE
ncbi:DUF6520 family protein [Galbibacter sp. BG1]